MNLSGIYIDDAGTPGADSGSDYLPEDRKSWAAVIIPRSVANDVEQAMNIILAGIKQDFGANELHFTEIYSGRGAWRGRSVVDRLEIFRLTNRIMSGFQIPIVYRTTSKSTLADHQNYFEQWKRKPGSWWNVEDLTHLSLLFMFVTLNDELKQLNKASPTDFPLPLKTYVDEGIAQAGRNITLPRTSSFIEGEKLNFAKSEDQIGLQLADYAAFVISRSQWIMAKKRDNEKIPHGDSEFLKSNQGLNILNLSLIGKTPESFSYKDFEALMAADRVNKGLPERPISAPPKKN